MSNSYVNQAVRLCVKSIPKYGILSEYIASLTLGLHKDTQTWLTCSWLMYGCSDENVYRMCTPDLSEPGYGLRIS